MTARDFRLASEVAAAERFLAGAGEYSALGRTDRIRWGLSTAVMMNRLIGWQLSAPEGRRRWELNGYGFTRVLSTSEVELWLAGYYAGMA